MKHEKEKAVYVLPRIEATDVAVERGFSWAGESDNEEYDIEKEIWG